MTAVLGGAGYGVIEASEGIQALAALRAADEIHVIVSDVNMPVMDGLALAAAVKEQFPGLPVVLVSGAGQPHTAEEFVAKPFHPETLLTAVSRVLSNRLISR